MKTFAGGVAAILIACLFGACSKPTPSNSLLEVELRKSCPAHLEFVVAQREFSPLKEIMGTTLPAGTYQVQVQCRVKTKEPLFVEIDPTDREVDKRLPENLRTEFGQLLPLAQGVYELQQHADWKKPDAVPRLLPFLAQTDEAGATRDVWLLMAATPLGKGWDIAILEGKLEAAFRGAKPRRAFNGAMLVYGSDEQRNNVSDVRTAVERGAKRTSVRRQTDARARALRAELPELAAKLKREAEAELKSAQRAFKEANDQFERRVDEIDRKYGTMADGYAKRDRLWREERKQFAPTHDKLLQAASDAQNRVYDVEERAAAQINARLRQLYVDAGLTAPEAELALRETW